MTADTPLAVEQELLGHEPIFHRPELGTSRAAFEELTSPDYWEVGASGKRYDREYVWSVLSERYAAGAHDPWEISDFSSRQLGGQSYLVTYRLRQAHRVTRRATIWERTSTGWRAIYHQGTDVSGG